MKLVEFLETVPGGKTVYIGSDIGFFFGGTKEQLLSDLPVLNIKYKAVANTQKENALKDY